MYYFNSILTKNLDPEYRLEKEQHRVQKLEKVKDNLKQIIKNQAEKIAKMQLKKLEKLKRINKDRQESEKRKKHKLMMLKGNF